MYDSPTCMSMAVKSNDCTTLQIRVFCERLYGFIYGASGKPLFVKRVFQEMVLPENNDINVSLGIHAQHILFLAAIEDLRRDNVLHRSVLPEDIHAANTFRSSLIEKIHDFDKLNMSMREIRFYRRDIAPLLGVTLRTQLLGLA